MNGRALLLAATGAGGLAAAVAWAAPTAPGGDARRGGELFAQQCAVCHGGNGGVGPNLHGVTGRKAGSLPGFGYSAALSKAGFHWDDARLNRYLTDPQALVPGTSMPAKVADAGQRRDIIAYLHTLRAEPKPPPKTAPPPGATAKQAGKVVVFGDWRADSPGQRHRITTADLPAPFATSSAGNGPKRAARPAGKLPQVPTGMSVTVWAQSLQRPRALKTAPNGDVFVAEAGAGRVSVLRQAGAKVERTTFVDAMTDPFGIAFYPAGPNPQWVYLAETNRVRRFPYAVGDLKPRGAPQMVVAKIADTTGGHTSRDLAVSRDGERLFVSVGSASNVAEEMVAKSAAGAQAYDRTHGLGATWGAEAGRADVLSFTPEGGDRRIFATGIRNCVGLAVQPAHGTLWCSTNERDELGDNLVPDYVTSVREGGFYGWPWRYMGDHEDPRLKGQRPDLAGKTITPDVMIQPHSASLQMAFYDGAMFPQWKGSILAAEHGSWNRALRTGYKLIRIPVGADGRAEGGYEDVMTGFVLDPGHVWGRPVGVAVAKDGAVLVSDDASGVIWRLAK